MGQHLQLYASRKVSLEDAKEWCDAEIHKYSEVPTGPKCQACKRVQSEMDAIGYKSEDHIEHWANTGGVAAFGFLDCEAHLCDQALVDRAIESGREYHELQIKHNPGSNYAKHDWENDSAVEFLKSHIGYVVWGYNDGV